MAEWLKKIAADEIRRANDNGGREMREEHAPAELIMRLHTVIAVATYEHLKSAAPGIAEPARRAIANNLAIKLSRKLETETAAVRDRLRAEKEELIAAIQDCANGGPCAKCAIPKATATEGGK